MYRCETCGERVRPGHAPEIICAVELLPAGTFGRNNDVIEGRFAYFHPCCYPSGTNRYRQKPLAPEIEDAA